MKTILVNVEPKLKHLVCDRQKSIEEDSQMPQFLREIEGDFVLVWHKSAGRARKFLLEAKRHTLITENLKGVVLLGTSPFAGAGVTLHAQ